MTIAIIAPQGIYAETIRKALSSLPLDVQTYGWQEREKIAANSFSLMIVAFDDATTPHALDVATKTEVIGISVGQAAMTADQKGQFMHFLPAPVKLGFLADMVAHFCRQRAARERLKPITMGQYILDPRTSTLGLPHAPQPAKLTEKEQDILIYLNNNHDQPVSRQALLHHVWGYVEGVETHTLETHIYRLRQKIEADPTAPAFLMTNEDGYFLHLS